MPFDVQAFLADKRPNTASVPIARDPDVIEAHARARAAADVARAVVDENPTPTARAALAEAEEALEEAEEAAEAVTQVFIFKGLPDHEWDTLLDDHAPTKDQVTQAKKRGVDPPKWNEDTFPQALVAACSFDPELTVEDVEQLFKAEQMNGAETGALFYAAFDASRSRRVPQLGKGFGRTLS
jgi:hypothetical protein